ncbi:MAG: co-chaperone GroES, partial [Planctomycetota bacterium]
MAKQKITPLNDKILVKRLEAVDTTEGGIVLPDAAKEKPREGEVV